MKEIKIYEIPNIDFIERIDDPYIGMIFYVADIDTYYSVKTLKEINGINMKGSKVVEYVIDEYADFGTGSGGGSGLTATQLSNIAKIPAIQSTVDALPNNYASKDHNHSEYASSSHRHDASEIDNLPSGGGTGLTTEQAQQLTTAYKHSQSDHVSMDEVNQAIANAQLSGGEVDLSTYATKTYTDNAISTALDGHTFKFLTQAEYDALETKDPLVEYHITDTTKPEIIDITSFATDLSLTGSNLQLKNKQGNLIGNAITLPSTSGSVSETVTVVKDVYANNEMPKMYVTSDRLGSLAGKADGTADCEVEIRFNRQTIKCYATGAVQGTSSASLPAKNYTFKFYSDAAHSTKNKIDVGWGKQNKYCFKKNYVDSTHTRNISGARIAYDMVNSRPESDFKNNLLTAPRNGVIDGFPCKVYLNGEFWGLYTWNIPKDAWMFNMSDDNPTHMVLCAEYNNNGDNTQNNTCEFRALWGGESDANWSIEVGTYSETLKNSFNNAISHVMNSSDEDFKTNFSNYFDLDSVLDYYCFSYLTAHIDGLAKNMLMATYDGIHWGACLYDMDSIYGADWNGASFKEPTIDCPSEYQETNSLLWQRIKTCFAQELYDRYFELRKGALSLGNIITHVEEIYDLIPDRVFTDDREKWTGIPTAGNTITRFRNYMRDRAAYVDEQFAGLIEDKSVTSVSIEGNTSVRIGNSITLKANLTPAKATIRTGTWSINNSNAELNESTGLTVTVTGSSVGTSIITFTSDDTTNGTISDSYTINITETPVSEATLSDIQAVHAVTLDGSQDINIPSYTEWVENQNYVLFEYTPQEVGEKPFGCLIEEEVLNSLLLPNIDPAVLHSNPAVGISRNLNGTNTTIAIGLSTSETGGKTIDDIKNYLSNNPLAIYIYPYDATIVGENLVTETTPGKIVSNGVISDGGDNITNQIEVKVGDRLFVRKANWIKIHCYKTDGTFVKTISANSDIVATAFTKPFEEDGYVIIQYYQLDSSISKLEATKIKL